MCDTLVVVGERRVLFAKNSDREPDEAQGLEWHPRRDHAPGEALRCTHLTIPQAPHTHAVLLSRPVWMWGAEIGANEHGVAIGNEAVFTRGGVPRTGLTGMDLLRLGLERAESAAQAVEVMRALLERHGQGGRCGFRHTSFRYFSSFLVADRHEALVLETAGRDSAVERVARGARSISNGLTIGGFAERHSDRVKTAISACRVRRAITLSGAAAADGPAALAALLRSHGAAAWPRYRWYNGAMDSPCMHAGGLLASSQTTASWISELSVDGDRHWATGTAAPCLSIFKPVRVTEPLALPMPGENPDGSLFWQHEALHRAAIADPERLVASFLAERDALERRFFETAVEPAEAFALAREAEQRWTVQLRSTAARDLRPWWARRRLSAA